MATASKRGRRPSQRSKKKLKKNQNPGIAEEILLFGAIGLSVLMFLACCKLLGSFGEVVGGVLIGTFGMVGFLFPFIFVVVSAFIISNKWEKVAKVKLLSSIVLTLVLCIVAQLLFSYDTVSKPVDSLKDYYTTKAVNGGFTGGVLGRFFIRFLGLPGTIVILLVLFIICIVLLTDRSFFTSLKEGGRMLTEDVKRNARYKREVNEVRSMEREERDLERWARRNEKHERHMAKKEEKRAAQLEARKRKIEERKAENASRMNFDASNLKGQDDDGRRISEDYYEIEAVAEEADETLTYPGESVVSEEEIRAMTGPESIFYGNPSEYISGAGQRTEDAPEEEAPDKEPGIMQKAKLEPRDYKGDVTEITGYYEGASEEELFGKSEVIDVPKPTVRSMHRISFSAGEEAEDDEAYDPSLKEAYERDIYVDDTETFEDDYSDVAEIFDKRSNINEVVPGTREKTEQKASHRIDLAEENRKPAPESHVVAKGKNIRGKKGGRIKPPPVNLLDEVRVTGKTDASAELNETARELRETLKNFGLDINITGSSRGPAVTRYEVQLPVGVSVKKITGLADDIMMSLGAKDIRIEAPIPGKKAVGIELPNRESSMVHFRELIDSKTFKNFDSKVAFAVGKDLSGDIVVTDIAKMPHLLIAGATGSGKSVCINTIIMSILYKATPDEVKLIMIDPKMVELSVYNGIPHLLIPVVTDPRKASAALSWAVAEMTSRYQKFAEMEVRDMKGYNAKVASNPSLAADGDHEKMPQIVIVVDELADLMMVAAKEVEESIIRLAQLARAAGIYLILATQRPSVDVITGIIKANMPSRIAFSVSSSVDSRTILDMVGAERLLGNGDMFFYPRGYNKPARVQGAFVSDDEVMRVVEFLKDQTDGDVYDEKARSAVEAGGAGGSSQSPGLVDPAGAYDDLFAACATAVIESQKASIGMLQRKFKIGFNRAARIMDQLADEGVVGPEEGTKARKILMTIDQFNELLEEKNHP
ncbi:MAG: DNA translocase FtsK 4TM domain-containing protein [Lachnospiraceae bacterium]|nr:DNA translocase FtsK 4TM domain-containing protein [Lachnospiraceae bacterium]